tara:strand:- start:1741 stop:2619 length:879 start_codon:yes stop_codon:yes gene_type:complete
MPFSVDAFKAHTQHGLAEGAAFALYLPAQGQIPGVGTTLSQEALSYMGHQAVLPGKHFNTTEYMDYGPIRKMPYQTMYDDLQISLFCRPQMRERKLFDAWQQFIHNSSDYYWQYFDNYKQDIELHFFQREIPAGDIRGGIREWEIEGGFSRAERHSKGGTAFENIAGMPQTHELMITQKVKFIDAYPINIAPIPLDWSSKDQFISLPVTFAYRKWELMKTKLEPYTETNQKLMKSGYSLREFMSWAANTLDLIDLYTDAVPTGLMQAMQLSGAGGTVSAILNEGLSRAPRIP